MSNSARLKVNTAIMETGYQPNLSARTVRTGSSKTIGYIVPDVRNPVYSEIFIGAQSALRPRGYELVLATSNGEFERQAAVVDSFSARRFDGLIMSLADENPAHLPPSFSTTPVVLIDRELIDPRTKAPLADVVLSDHGAGVRAAVRHLAQMRHRSIGILLGRADLYTTRSRYNAFLEAARDNGLDESDLYIRIGDRSVQAGYERTAELATAADRPTALICGSNQLLHGALSAINDLRIKVPSELSVIACEDSDICRLYKPSVTVIRRDIEFLGYTAAERLLNRLEARTSQKTDENIARPGEYRIVQPTELVMRESTAPPAF